MKNCWIILIALLLTILLSCKKVDSNPVDPELIVNSQTLQFDSLGGDQVLIIASNVAWEIQYDADWCRPSIGKDSGDITLYITADPNDSTFERTTFFTLASEKADNIEITINQTGKVKHGETMSEFANMRDISSLELSEQMGIGWNLGNTMEAIIINNDVYSGDETSWGNPRVTQKLIDSVKAAGFNAVRIPVAWTNHVVDESTYEIDEAWLNRVEEVVNYALNDDMYAFINVHWDGGWMDHPDNNHELEINTKLDALWTQIANYFIDYGDHLLFAGSNEVHIDGNYSAPSKENLDAQNSCNQTFVDAVRSTGGRNASRHLIVQGYNTNIDYTISGFVMPADVVENRLMVEIHFYDPYDFTLQGDGGKTQWGKDYAGGDVSSWGQEDWVDKAFGKMKTNFVDKGIPVILGEYGAILRSNLTSGLEKHIASRNHYLNYVTKTAVDDGIVPFYWDNGSTGNNSMGLFNRATGAQVHADAIQAVVSAASE